MVSPAKCQETGHRLASILFVSGVGALLHGEIPSREGELLCWRLEVLTWNLVLNT